jgi:hypothetical protein
VFFSGTEEETVLLSYPDAPWVEVIVGTYVLFIAVVIPFIIIFVANILIIYGVKRAAADRNKMSDKARNNSKEAHLTRMLILISVAFIVLCLPFGVSEVVLSQPDVAAEYDLRAIYWRLRLIVINYALSEISCMNHVVNFYLYILGGGKHYRNNVKAILRIIRRNRPRKL